MREVVTLAAIFFVFLGLYRWIDSLQTRINNLERAAVALYEKTEAKNSNQQ